MACEQPLIFLTSADGEPHPLLRAGSLQFAPWKLSEQPYRNGDSQTAPSSCFNTGPDIQLSSHTRRRGKRGPSGAVASVASVARYDATWPVADVFMFFNISPSNYQLDLKELCGKLATTLAFSTLLRTAEIASICLSSVVFSNDSVSFALSQPRKS